MTQPVLPSAETFLAALYNLALLRRLSGDIAEISQTDRPQSNAVTAPAGRLRTGALLLLPGAFNPPTSAHLELAQESLRAVPGAQLYFTLGTTTINKEQTERATLLDRLLLLDQMVRRFGNLGVLLTSRGLYVEQANAARAAFPQATHLYFVVGYDKIEQIFDARYYHDRDAALNELFALAKLLVAPRASHEAADLDGLLNQPENHQFQSAIQLIPFPADYRGIASSQVRASFQASADVLSISQLVELLLPESLAFARETGCYSPSASLSSGESLDRYALRVSLLNRILALPTSDQASIDFRALFVLAVSTSERGRVLRRWLTGPATIPPPFDLHAGQHPLPQNPAQTPKAQRFPNSK